MTFGAILNVVLLLESTDFGIRLKARTKMLAVELQRAFVLFLERVNGLQFYCNVKNEHRWNFLV